MISGTFPLWFPVWGGESYLFFSPVFNVADAAITVSVFFIIIFQKSFFPPEIKAEVSSSDSLTN
jgi:signal peptidase II